MQSFGRLFRVSIFGESHGPGISVGIDGCPAGIPLVAEDFEPDAARRRASAMGTTPRREKDVPTLLSGTVAGVTTGAPILLFVPNENTRSQDYSHLVTHPRPGHADFVASHKFFGHQDSRGGGHFSGRLTLALVLAGTVAKKALPHLSFATTLVEAGGNSNVEEAVASAMAKGDSVGGVISCRVDGIPIGWGEPFFDSVESVLAHILFSIPAVKGVEFGAGFDSARLMGSEMNDSLADVSGRTVSNHSGGINGGITNGNPLEFRVAIKPTSSIALPQSTLNLNSGKVEELQIGGRHDTCIALRAPVVVEACAAIALADLHLLRVSQETLVRQK